MRHKAVLLCAALFIAAFVLLPIPKPGEAGATNTVTGWMYCRERWACLHEIGHVLDRDAGWVSQSAEFAKAVQMYILANARIDDLPVYILAMTYTADDGQEPTKAELYAFLFQYSEGDAMRLPDGLRMFYDWDKGNELIRKRVMGQ